jgi:transposase
MTTPSYPDDLAACHALIEAQEAVIEQLQAELAQIKGASGQQAETIQSLQQRIEKLQHELNLFKRHVFGQRRERFIDDPRQGKLFEIDDTEAPQPELPSAESSDATPEKSSRRSHGRRRLPDSLPRRRVVHELSEAERRCPCCGKARVQVSEEISEQLEFQPATFHVVQHVRAIYVCQEQGCSPNMATAPKPPQPIEKGLAGPGMLAFVVTSKLAEHLPLNRLEDVTCRYGMHLARSTLCDWMAGCASLVRPLYRLMIAEILQSKVVGTDDTTVPVRDGDLTHTRTGYFWAYVGDQAHPFIAYDFTTSHSREGPKKFLQRFAGYLQADAYAGYLDIALQSKGQIQYAGCWAHARRYFDRARDKAPTQAVHQALAYIQRLYDVEDEAVTMSRDERWMLRQKKSAGILREFHDWLHRQAADVLPQSPLGEAINYTLNQWAPLGVYLQDADIPLDNNRTEHALRQQVLGRVNWLFAGSDRGGETAAVLYTLVATCKRLRIDPFAYLRDVFTRLPRMIDDTPLSELLPDRWIATHPDHRLVHREEQANQANERRRERRARRRELQKAQSK